MKNSFLLFLALTFFTSIAQARTYLGIDGQHINLSHSVTPNDPGKNYEDYYENQKFIPGIFLGTTIHKYFDIEANYSRAKFSMRNSQNIPDFNYSNEYNTQIKTDNLGFDLKPKYSFNNEFEIYGILGVNYIRTRVSESYQEFNNNNFRQTQFKDSKNKFTYSWGAGIQYYFTQNVMGKIQVKYTDYNIKYDNPESDLKSIKGSTNAAMGVGLAYQF
jgi:opacity protein-like surface antigen